MAALCAVMDSDRHPDLNKPLHCSNNQELTPLSISALVGSWDCCNLLLQRGADIATVDWLGRNALHWAIIAAHVDVVRQLIREGAPLDTLDREGFSPLCLAALSGSKEIANLILRQNTIPDMPHPPTGATPLMLACGCGDHAVAKAMLKCHADTNARDQLGHTPLHYGVWGGSHKCIRAVCSQSSYALSDSFGRTAFLLAASKACGLSKHLATASRNAVATQGNTELCNYFLGKGSHWSEQDGEGRNCIHWALLSGAVECVSFLVSHKDIDGRALCRQKDIRGSTPLHYAAITGSVELLELIVARCQEDLSPTDALGWTPLLWAALCGRASAVSHLLEAKVPVTSCVPVQPLHAAASTGADEVCWLLVEHGAEVNVRGPHSWTPLHYACRFGHAECVRLLLGLCAEVDCLTEELKTPLHIAALHGYTTILCQLLAAGASKDLTCPPNGESPAHLAARNGKTSALEVLLNDGYGVENGRTSDGRTLLHLSSMEGHLDCCQLLLHRGANPSLRDSTVERCTALDLAMLSSQSSCSVFLMSVCAPSGGGQYHRAALTIQAAWRFSRYKRRRHTTREWAAVVLQRAFRRVRLRRKSRRLRQVRARTLNSAATTIQRHWRGYIGEKRRYEATYARLRARLLQERAAAGIILHELNSQTHNMQLPSTATRHKPASSVSKFLLQAAAKPSVAMASGTILFPKEVPKPDLQRVTHGARSKTAPSPAAVVPTTFQVIRAMTAIEEGTRSGDKETHVKICSDNAVPSPKAGLTVPSPKAGLTVPSPKAGLTVPSPKAGLTVPSPNVGLPTPSPGIAPVNFIHDMKVVPRPINSAARQGSVERLPHLPITPSLVAATRKASGNSGKHRVSSRSNQAAIREPSNELATITTRPAALDTSSAALDTSSAALDTSSTPKVSTSPGRKATTTRGRPIKGSSYVNKQKGAWGGIEQEVVTTAARYSELNKILCALRQAQASPSLATDLGSSDLKEHIRATLNEAVRLRADTEVLQSKLNNSTTPPDLITS
eukprot:Em0011g48a